MKPIWHRSSIGNAWREDGVLMQIVGSPSHVILRQPGKAPFRIYDLDVYAQETLDTIDFLWPPYGQYDYPESMRPDLAMQRSLDLARKAQCAPNPQVGCVITDAHNRIVAEGFTQPVPGKHAEVVALTNVRVTKGPSFNNGTLYTTLEPCCHHGRTPPCTDAILAASGIRRVVIGTLDPNPLVHGGGIKALKQAGIVVIRGVLSTECTDLISDFSARFQEES